MSLNNGRSISIEEGLKKYIPDLLLLLDGQSVSWAKINKGYSTNHSKRRKKSLLNPLEKFEVNFYDLIALTLVRNDENAEKLFIYITVVLRRLNAVLNQQQKLMVGKTVRNFLKNFSLDYIHFIGELFFLDRMIASNEYELIMIEDKMKNGKDIDFRLYFKRNKQEILVEIMNVRLNTSNLESFSIFHEHLNRKVTDKIFDKTKGQISDYNFHLQPILWGSGDELKKVVSFYKNGFEILINGVMEPLAYCCLSYEGSEPKYRFNKITTLFD